MPRRVIEIGTFTGYSEPCAGPALRTLTSLADDVVFDLAFIDADKPSYIDYWEALIPRMRPGGLIILFGGQVVAPHPSEKPAAIRAFKTHAKQDSRVDLVMLPVADGITLARKRPGEDISPPTPHLPPFSSHENKPNIHTLRTELLHLS